MKKFILFLTIGLIFLTFNTIAQEEITCPDGWTKTTIEVNNFPNCDPIYVTLCYHCNPSTYETEITIKAVNGCNSTLVGSYLDFAQARILASINEFCQWMPCDSEHPEQKSDVYIRIPLCFYENDENAGEFLFCDESWCFRHYKVCSNPDNSVSKELVEQYQEGNPACAGIYAPQPPGICFQIMTCDNY